MIRLRCHNITEDQAFRIEELGDDLNPNDGFLRRDDNGDFFVLVDETTLGSAFDRFRKAYTSVQECEELDEIGRLPPLKIITVNAYLLVSGFFMKHMVDSPEPEKRLHLLTQWLNEQNADLVLIQEVNGEETYKEIKRLVHDATFGIYVGDFSDLIVLSRYPIVEQGFLKTRWQGSEHERCELLALTS